MRCCSKRSACPIASSQPSWTTRAMRDKHDYLQTFGVDNEADILRTLAMFGGFAEGLQLFASFAILLNFPRHNKMRGMGQVVSWSRARRNAALRGHHPAVPHVRERDRRADECRARRHRRLRADRRAARGPLHRSRVRARARSTASRRPTIKAYIRYIADWRLKQLGLPSSTASRSIRCLGSRRN